MFLLDENYNAIKKVEKDRRHFWIYDADNKDFFLRSSAFWYENVTDAYKMKVGDGIVYVPSGTHIMIGDYGSELDFIKPEEIVGREFDAVTFDRDLSEGSWRLSPLQVIGYEKEYTCFYPVINSPVLVLAGEHRTMLVSTLDIYRKIRNHSYTDFV